MVFKSFHGLVREYLTSKFIQRNESNYSLRDSVNKLVVPFPRTKYTKYSFSYSGATLWNSLLGNSRESGAWNQFKRLLYPNFKHGIQINQGPVVQKLISSNPGLNCNPPFFISLFKSLLGKIFTILLRTSNNQIASKKIWTEFLLKFSDLKSNFTLTLGYLNPALNNRGQVFKWRIAVS